MYIIPFPAFFTHALLIMMRNIPLLCNRCLSAVGCIIDTERAVRKSALWKFCAMQEWRHAPACARPGDTPIDWRLRWIAEGFPIARVEFIHEGCCAESAISSIISIGGYLMLAIRNAFFHFTRRTGDFNTRPVQHPSSFASGLNQLFHRPS